MLDRLFEGDFGHALRFWPELRLDELPVDMYQTDKDVVARVSLPGVKPGEVEVSITGDVLTIKGEHKEEQEDKGKEYLYREHRYGAFSRSLVLPVAVKDTKAEAAYEDGILTVTIPKAEEVKPKTIKVKAREIEGKK